MYNGPNIYIIPRISFELPSIMSEHDVSEVSSGLILASLTPRELINSVESPIEVLHILKARPWVLIYLPNEASPKTG